MHSCKPSTQMKRTELTAQRKSVVAGNPKLLHAAIRFDELNRNEALSNAGIAEFHRALRQKNKSYKTKAPSVPCLSDRQLMTLPRCRNRWQLPNHRHAQPAHLGHKRPHVRYVSVIVERQVDRGCGAMADGGQVDQDAVHKRSSSLRRWRWRRPRGCSTRSSFSNLFF